MYNLYCFIYIKCHHKIVYKEEEYNDLNNKINNLKMIIDISNTNTNLRYIK